MTVSLWMLLVRKFFLELQDVSCTLLNCRRENTQMSISGILISWAVWVLWQECHLLLLKDVISSVQSLSHVLLFVTPWTAACQASLSITNSRSLLKLTSIESVMPSNHLILCRPLLLLHSIFPSIRVFSNESALRIRWPKYWSFSFSISPSNEYSGLISFRIDWFDGILIIHNSNLSWTAIPFFQEEPQTWKQTHIENMAKALDP